MKMRYIAITGALVAVMAGFAIGQTMPPFGAVASITQVRSANRAELKLYFPYGTTLSTLGLTAGGKAVVIPVVDCQGYWPSTWTEVPPRVTNPDGSITVTEQRTYVVTRQPTPVFGAACPSPATQTRTYLIPPPPPEVCGDGIDNDRDGQIDEGCPVEKPLWGATVDPEVLGTCSAAVHDQYIVDGGDGFRYRTWHPQQDPSGCNFGHEHGMNPALMQNAEIASAPIRFGYIGRRMNHDEPHQGFKIFIANPGDVNDEGRVNRVFSRSVFHMGTGGPLRFNTQHHSAEIRLVHPEFGLKAFTQLMMDTGGVAPVCDPRKPAPTKDVVRLDFIALCGKKLGSFYEIWSTQASVMYQGREIYRAFATPAVFDPNTVFNPANPNEVVSVEDDRVSAIMEWPNNSRSYFRGCDRESYAQPGYWYNGGTGRTVYYTDAMGNELPSTDPNALAQVISTSNSVGAPATNDGLVQFKLRVAGLCGPGLSKKN